MSEETIRLQNLREICHYVILRDLKMGEDLRDRVVALNETLKRTYPVDTRFGFMLSNDHSLINITPEQIRPASEQMYFHCFRMGPDNIVTEEVVAFWLVSFKLSMIDDQSANIYTLQ